MSQRETTWTFPSASLTSPQQTLVSTTVWSSGKENVVKWSLSLDQALISLWVVSTAFVPCIPITCQQECLLPFESKNTIMYSSGCLCHDLGHDQISFPSTDQGSWGLFVQGPTAGKSEKILSPQSAWLHNPCLFHSIQPFGSRDKRDECLSPLLHQLSRPHSCLHRMLTSMWLSFLFIHTYWTPTVSQGLVQMLWKQKWTKQKRALIPWSLCSLSSERREIHLGQGVKMLSISSSEASHWEELPIAQAQCWLWWPCLEEMPRGWVFPGNLLRRLSCDSGIDSHSHWRLPAELGHLRMSLPREEVHVGDLGAAPLR